MHEMLETFYFLRKWQEKKININLIISVLIYNITAKNEKDSVFMQYASNSTLHKINKKKK